MNIERLEFLEGFFRNYPHKCVMSTWMKTSNCGTVGCICGWAQFFFPVPLFYHPFAAGEETLSLTHEQAWKLFVVRYWPHQFQEEHRNQAWKGGPFGEIVARRIRHFIDTEGRE